MAIVEDVDGSGGIVLQCERLQRCVVCSLARYNVNGRLARSICDREVVSPFVGSCNRKSGVRESYQFCIDNVAVAYIYF